MDLLPFIHMREFYCTKCQSRKCTVRYCTRDHTADQSSARIHGDKQIQMTTRDQILNPASFPPPATFQSAESLARQQVENTPVTAVSETVTSIEHLHNTCARCGHDAATECADAKG